MKRKQEARILVLYTCNNGILLLVLRGRSFEEIDFSCTLESSSLVNKVKKLKCFEEIRYFIAFDNHIKALLGSLGFSLINGSEAEEYMLDIIGTARALCNTVNKVCFHSSYNALVK